MSIIIECYIESLNPNGESIKGEQFIFLASIFPVVKDFIPFYLCLYTCSAIINHLVQTPYR